MSVQTVNIYISPPNPYSWNIIDCRFVWINANLAAFNLSFCKSFPEKHHLLHRNSKDLTIFSLSPQVNTVRININPFRIKSRLDLPFIKLKICVPTSRNCTYSLVFNHLSCNQHPSESDIPHLISTNDVLTK